MTEDNSARRREVVKKLDAYMRAVYKAHVATGLDMDLINQTIADPSAANREAIADCEALSAERREVLDLIAENAIPTHHDQISLRPEIIRQIMLNGG